MGIRTVVVGYGRAGKHFHCYLIRLAPGLTLYGVVSGDADKRARIEAEQGCRAYASLEEALADREAQLFVFATPHSTHAPMAIQAMNAGRHVVVEKVMCLNLAECDAMIAAARRNGVLLSVFQNRRFDGDFLTVRRLMDSGELGETRWIEMAWQSFGASRNWRSQAAMGGGKYYDLGAHMVDQLLLLFPDAVESVYCRMRYDFPGGLDIMNEALLVVTFEGGRTGIVDCSAMAAISKPRFYVRGTKGAFQKYGVDPQEAAMMKGDIDAAAEDPKSFGVFSDGKARREVPTLRGRWRDYYENIAAVLNEGAKPAVSLASLRRQIAVLDAGMRSAQIGEVVRPAIGRLEE